MWLHYTTVLTRISAKLFVSLFRRDALSSTIAITMKDKIILITGSTDGIGKETARQLAQLGATVIVHGRSVDRCEAARDDIRATTGNPHVDFVVADLSAQWQVRQMAAEIIARYDRLHVLINNAGVILPQRQLS